MPETADLTSLLETARVHATNARNDLNYTSTRVEHVRVTTLALEAEALVSRIEALLAATARV